MILFFILGTLIGSFLNVVIFRFPNNESIITPRSHCRNCKKNIPFYLNIPILSYIILKGKCQSCKTMISPQYIIVEFLTEEADVCNEILPLDLAVTDTL